MYENRLQENTLKFNCPEMTINHTLLNLATLLYLAMIISATLLNLATLLYLAMTFNPTLLNLATLLYLAMTSIIPY